MTRPAFALITATVVALTLGCTEEPESRIPLVPVPGLGSVELSGPARLAPGQSAQFTVNVRLLDGALKLAPQADIVRWRVSDASVLQVLESGLATAHPRTGETTVSVDVKVGAQTKSATREIVIVPDGTYRLVGKITEKDFATHAVVGARVEVAEGTAAATTDINGQYRLYGVPASAVIRVTAAGFADIEQTVSLSGHGTRDFQMAFSGHQSTLSGPYTLTVDAASNCSGSSLPAALRNRRYDASISQNGSTIDVELTEPLFAVNVLGRGNKFTGRTMGSGVVFTLRNYAPFYYYYYVFPIGPESYPDVAERLANNSFLVVEGRATVFPAGGTLSGLLSGTLANWNSQFPDTPMWLGGCFSDTHPFVLTPR